MHILMCRWLYESTEPAKYTNNFNYMGYVHTIMCKREGELHIIVVNKNLKVKHKFVF